LAEVGYGDLTIEAVAARAAVGKPTIYRWWKNKAHLAYEAACTSAMSEVPEDTGDLDVDLRAFVERVEGFLCREEVSAAFRGMLTDPWVLNQVSERLILPAREHLGRIIERAGGAVRPDLDVRAFYDLAVGAIVNRALQPSSGRQRPRQWVDSIVTMLIDAVRA
jgi:AcrR family transcriptional regulator